MERLHEATGARVRVRVPTRHARAQRTACTGTIGSGQKCVATIGQGVGHSGLSVPGPRARSMDWHGKHGWVRAHLLSGIRVVL